MIQPLYKIPVINWSPKNIKIFNSETFNIMKLPKLYINLLLVLLLCGAAVSCDLFELESRAYDGSSVVGFRFQSDQVEAATADTSAYNINLEVQLIRNKEGMLDEALPINFIVVDSSTATSPDDYEILTTSPITIPAGSLKTSLDIRVNGSGIPVGQARTLILQLTGNESRGVKGGDVIGNFELIIEGQ